jgi:PAS domain S-box-containing protein/putative nucleotidyltransferase with HDIG domain
MRVLIVDDSASNVDFLEQLLRGKGYDVISATNGEKALRKLQKETVDLIISDVAMPVMDGIRFLQACREDARLKNVPFMLLTDTRFKQQDKDLAIKLGAMTCRRKKDEPDELVKVIEEAVAAKPVPKKRGRKPQVKPAVEKRDDPLNLFTHSLVQKLENKMQELEIEIAERKKAEVALRESEERFRIGSASASDLIWDWNIATGRLDWFGQIDEMLGYSPGEFPRTIEAWEKSIHPDDRERVDAILEKHLKEGTPYEEKYRVVRKDGNERYWVDRGITMYDTTGKPYRMVGACTDITERIQAEERAVIRRDLVKSLVTTVNLDDALKLCLDAALKITGMDSGVIYLVDERTGGLRASAQRGFSEDIVSRYSKLGADSANARLIMKGQPLYVRREEFTTPFDEQFSPQDFSVAAVIPVKHADRVIACLIITSRSLNDVQPIARSSLETIAAEIGSYIDRIKAGEALRASEQRYRFIADNTADVIWAMDSKLRYTYISPSVTRQRGYTVEEAMALNITRVLTPDSQDTVLKHLQAEVSPEAGVRSGSISTFTREMEMSRKDGTTFWTETSFTLLRTADGEFAGLLGISRDITGRRQLEEAVVKSEERYRTILERMQDAYYEVDLSGNFTFANEFTCHSLGYTREEMMGKSFRLMVPEDEKKNMFIAFNEVYRTGEPNTGYAHSILRRDGSIIFAESSIHLRRNKQGEVTGFSSVSRDITERKQAEEALKQREELFQALVEDSSDVITIIDAHGTVQYQSPNYKTLWGRDPSGEIGRDLFKDIHPDDVALVSDRFNYLLLNPDGTVHIEVRAQHADGSWLTIDVVGHNLLDHPAVRGIVVHFHDITERKQAEDNLRESEERYLALFDRSLDLVFTRDFKGNFIDANPAALNLLGYQREDIPNLSIVSLLSPDQYPKTLQTLKELSETGRQKEPTEYKLKCKDGRHVDVETRESVIYRDGKPYAVQGIGQDITERKLAEQALSKSEEKYRSILEQMDEGYYELDSKGNYTFVNDAICRQIGYLREELMGLNYKAYTPPGERRKVVEAYSGVFSTGKPRDWLRMVNIRKDGTSIFVEDSIYPLRDEKGEIIGLRGISRDITSKRQAEAALQESEERFRRITENAPDVIYRYRLKPTPGFEYVSPASVKISGYTPEEYYADSLLTGKVVHPEDQDQFKQYFRSLGSLGTTLVLRWIHKDGRVIWTEEIDVPIYDANGEIVALEGIARDITDRKKAEEELKQALEQISMTLEGTIEAIAMMSELRDPYTAGHQRMVTKLALAIAEELGLSQDQKQTLRIAGLLHDIGKVNVPSEILSKPGKLSELEKGLTKAHVEASYDIVKAIKFPWPVCRIVIQHHERMNGSGYPHGLSGDKITLEAKILAVADVVEAMMSHRPYRPALGQDKALDEITKNRGTLYDESVVDACLRLFSEKGFKFAE